MTVVTSVVVTGAVVTAGRLVSKQDLNMRMVSGLAVVFIFLAVLEETNAKLAQQMGLLIMVGALLFYGTEITKTLGKKP